MPLIELSYPAGTFSAESRTSLVDELSTVLLRAERAPDTEFFRSITWAFVNEFPAGCVLQGGRPVTRPIFRVNISVPEGALSERHKQELVSEATRVISEAAGLTEQDGLRVWVLIRDVPEGNWGAAGNIVRFEQLRQAAQPDGREREAIAAENGAPAATSA